VIWVGIAIALLGTAGAGAIAFRNRPSVADHWYRTFSAAGCTVAVAQSLQILVGGALPVVTVLPAIPWGRWEIGLDRLSAWFLLLIGVVGAATATFGVSYLAVERRHHRPVAFAHAMLALLLAAMMALVSARAAVPFLLAWELMAVSAYLLINFDGHDPQVRRAGLLYLVLTHAGTLALMVMFLLWGRRGPDLTFTTLGAAGAGIGGGSVVLLLLATFGFGVKAGLVPFHFWLPGAHAAAPSHVSALLSGVMIKTGIYGLLRVIELLKAVPAWWGWLLLLLGASTGVLGVLWALAQRDLKRVLAYSSVENIGLVLLAMGTGVLGVAAQRPELAALGFAGAVLHALNHALFKSLLFLGSGVVVRATGTRAIDRLGGLARRMPLTALLLTLGAVAICGLPPLNGFASEWVIVRGLLSAGLDAGFLRIIAAFAGAIGLIGALAVACFTRILATMLLGAPRAAEDPTGADSGGDPPLGARVAMIGLVTACLVLGLVPAIGLTLVDRVVYSLGLIPRSGGMNLAASAWWITIAALAFTGVLALIAWWAASWRGSWVPATTWACGFTSHSARMQYTASSYAAPILSGFGGIARPPVLRGPASLETLPEDRVLRAAVLPGWDRIKRAAAVLRPIQHGRLTSYVFYVIATLLGLLAMLYTAVRRS